MRNRRNNKIKEKYEKTMLVDVDEIYVEEKNNDEWHSAGLFDDMHDSCWWNRF